MRLIGERNNCEDGLSFLQTLVLLQSAMLFFLEPKRFDDGHWLIQGVVKLIKCLHLEHKNNEKKKKKKKGKKRGKKRKSSHCLKVHRGRIQYLDKAFAGTPSLTTIFLPEPIKQQSVFTETQL